MSHFTVMVIGKNPEKQLKPYDENKRVPEYEKGIVSAEEIGSFVGTYTEYKPERGYGVKSEAEAIENQKLSFKELYEKYGEDWNGNDWKLVNGVCKEFSTYNPKSKWDWYQLGGRWRGFLKLKKDAEGIKGEPSWTNENKEIGDEYADSARLGDIDFNGMFEEARAEAKKSFKRAHELIAGESFVHWKKVREEMFPNEIDKARDFYNNQPPVKRFCDSREFGIFSIPDEYDIPEADFLKQAEDGTLSTFAVLKDGKWYEKGDMGWWGVVSNEQDQNEWNKRVNELITGLPEDTLISIYDCHI